MSNKWSGVKSIVTYYQDDEPSNPKAGEIWYRPSAQSSYLYNGNIWKTVRGTNYFYPLSDGNYGYTMGGYWSGNFQTLIQRIQYPFDSGTGSNVGNMTMTIRENCGCNSTNYGYSLSGRTLLFYVTNVERITFPFNSGTANHTGNLSYSLLGQAGVNSSVHGFACGGVIPGGTTRHSSIGRFEFPFDSGTGTHVGNLANSIGYNNGCNSTEFGYSCGGSFGDPYPVQSFIFRFAFPFDSGTASSVGNLSGTRNQCESINSSNYGYIMGGYDASPYISIIDRILFPFNSGTAVNTGNLANSAVIGHGVNSSKYGYYIGGNGTSSESSVERIEFPFDSGTASVVGNMSSTSTVGAGVTETLF